MSGESEQVERLLKFAQEQDVISRGSTTYLEQQQRRQEILWIREQLKKDRATSKTAEDLLRFIDGTLRLENFMVSIPFGVQVVPVNMLKQLTYLNHGGTEQRIYFAPHFFPRDSDSITVVLAITPPAYAQPLHAHFQTNEYTLSLVDNVGLRYRRGKTDNDINADRGQMAISPRGLAHAVFNRTQIYSPNISVKLPEALEDRIAVDPRSFTLQTVENANIMLPEKDEGEYFSESRHMVRDRGYEYRVTLTTFKAGRPVEIKPANDTEVNFVTDGSFFVRSNGKRQFAAPYSLIVVDPGEKAMITPANNGTISSLYKVELLKSQ